MTETLPGAKRKYSLPKQRQRAAAAARPAASMLTLLVALSFTGTIDAAVAEDALPIMGQTLSGTHLRATPDASGDLMATLPPGRAVPIIRRMDQTHEGYNWFQVAIGHQVGYQWGGALCSNDRQIAGLLQQCDPTNLKQVGAGPNGITWVSGLYMMGRGNITGTDDDLDICPKSNYQAVLWDFEIDDDGNTVSFPYYTCDIASTEPLATGLHIKGECSISDWADGDFAHNLTEAERELDILVFYADNLNTLHVVDQSGPDSGHITTYAACLRFFGPYSE